MARRKKKKAQKPSDWFSFGKKKSKSGGKRKKATETSAAVSYKIFLGILALGCVAGGVVIGFNYLDKHVQATSSVIADYGQLYLVGKPDWFNSQLMQNVEIAAGSKHFALEEGVAGYVAEGLESMLWLYDVKVQTTSNSIKITAGFRKPMALVNYKGKKYYVADDLMVLDYVPLGKMAIPEMTGYGDVPVAGEAMDSDAVASAVAIIKIINKMDSISEIERPLLGEISSIDVSNLGGRQHSKKPHIVLRANDGTQVYWGASVGEASRYVEASEKEKLAMLYAFYAEHGTLQGVAKFIELRYPQKELPTPK
ncbi:MAG: hypothetical protein KAJ07_12870 [Planctomycetes bacterium]|nr:hypothetical protein [Planctomycetota bacterium]